MSPDLWARIVTVSPVTWIFFAVVLSGVLFAIWQFGELSIQKRLPLLIKQHVEILLKVLRTKDPNILFDPSLNFLARHLKIDLYAPKYGDPDDFLNSGMIKFLKDVLKRHRNDPSDRRLFTTDEIDGIILELDEMILKPGTVICFECGAKILPDQNRCPGCGWDWKGSFHCPECEAEMFPGQDRCASCGWIWK